MAALGMPEWRPHADRETLDHALAETVADCLRAGIADRGTAYLVVSGGSTPANLFARLARAPLDWSCVFVTLADERWVATDHKDSNERLVRATLLTEQAKAAAFLSLVQMPNDAARNLSQVAERLAALPEFDVVLLGMGEDAHTASLFPCAHELERGLTTTESALITHPQNAPYERISLSKQRLLRTRCGMIHIVGERKKAVFEVASAVGDETTHPINAFLGPAGFDCWWAP
jgi:6-phosphogluconolactonase